MCADCHAKGLDICRECQTAIEQNVDCNEEIIDPDLFRNLFTNK